MPTTLTRSKASGSSSRFQGRGGGVTGKEQDRDKTVARQGKDRGTRQEKNRDKTETKCAQDTAFRGIKKFSGVC